MIKDRHTLQTVDEEANEAERQLAAMQKDLGITSPAPPAPALPAAIDAPPLTTPPAQPVIEPPLQPVVPEVKKGAPVVDKDKLIKSLEGALSKARDNEKVAFGRLTKQAEDLKLAEDRITALEGQISGLQSELAEAKSRPAASQQPQAPEVPTAIRELQNDLGIDDASGKRLHGVIQGEIQAGIQAALTTMGFKPGTLAKEAPVAQTKTAPPALAAAQPAAAPPKEEMPNLSTSSWSVFFSYIPESVYDEIYNDGKFSPELLEFFALPVPKTEFTNGILAQRAVEADDPVRLADIYKEFLVWNADPKRPQRPLAPDTGGKVNTKLDTSKPTYLLKDAEAFMKEYQKNVGSYTPEELQKAQKQLDIYEAAGAEGRLL